MIEFICIPYLLELRNWVAMVTMHFHIAQMSLCLGTLFLIQGGPGNNLASMKNCHGGAKQVKLDSVV